MPDQPIDLLHRTPMRNLIVRIVAKELVSPDRHVPRPVSSHLRLPVNDPEDLQFRKLPATPGSDPREIRYFDRQKRGDRPVSPRILTVTGRARDPEKPRSRCWLANAAGRRRTAAGKTREQYNKPPPPRRGELHATAEQKRFAAGFAIASGFTSTKSQSSESMSRPVNVPICGDTPAWCASAPRTITS